MHALPGKWREVDGQTRGDDEFYITGVARLVQDAETRRLVTETAKHEIRETDWLFEFDIERAMTAYWEKVGQPGTYAVRQYWHAPINGGGGNPQVGRHRLFVPFRLGGGRFSGLPRGLAFRPRSLAPPSHFLAPPPGALSP